MCMSSVVDQVFQISLNLNKLNLLIIRILFFKLKIMFFLNWQNLSMFALELLKNDFLDFLQSLFYQNQEDFWYYNKLCSPKWDLPT